MCIDSEATICDDKQVVIYAWYDNELGYCVQLLELLKVLQELNIIASLLFVMRNITISKGLDIPISGEVTDSEITKHVTKKVAVLGKDYHDLKPTMLVKVGDQVKKGQKLLEDKKFQVYF